MPPELAPWFSGVMLGAEPVLSGAPAVLEPPDHGTTLTWRVGSTDPHDIVIMGPRTRARYHAARPGRDCLQLRFRPGRAAEFLGRPLRDLTDRATSAGDLGSEALRALLRASGAHPAAPDSYPDLLRALAEAMPSPDAPARLPGGSGQRRSLVAAAIAMLSVGDDTPAQRVAVVARRLDVSERHLRAVFTDTVGVSPSRFTSIDRIRTVLARLGQRLPDLAAGTGFYDQSHLGAEFRRAMGTTPRAFTRRHWPAPEVCTAPPPDRRSG
jgi:AraC-like DNA-binding protein